MKVKSTLTEGRQVGILHQMSSEADQSKAYHNTDLSLNPRSMFTFDDHAEADTEIGK